jgi:hypothetical protein
VDVVAPTEDEAIRESAAELAAAQRRADSLRVGTLEWAQAVEAAESARRRLQELARRQPEASRR